MRRGKRKEVVFTESEWEIITSKSKLINLNTTQYIKEMSLQGFIIEYPITDIKNIIYELNKIGTNINQIARKVNETNSVSEKDIILLNKKMEDIWHLLQQSLPYINP